MGKKIQTRRTSTLERVEIETKNPVTIAIKNFIETGETSSDLDGLTYTIRVQKFDNSLGRFVTLVGTQYTELDQLLPTLRSKWGTARFKLYINPTDAEGKKYPLCVIPDLPILDDPGDDDPAGDPANDAIEPYEPAQTVKPSPISVTDILLKQMEMSNALLIAIVTKSGVAGGGGGHGLDVDQIVKLITLGQTMSGPVDGGEGGGGGDDIIASLIKSPIGEKLVTRVMENMNAGGRPAVTADDNHRSDPKVVASD